MINAKAINEMVRRFDLPAGGMIERELNRGGSSHADRVRGY